MLLLVCGSVSRLGLEYGRPSFKYRIRANNIENSARSLRCGQMLNGDQLAAEVANSVFDLSIGAFNPPGIGLCFEIVCGFQDGRFDCVGTLRSAFVRSLRTSLWSFKIWTRNCEWSFDIFSRASFALSSLSNIIALI